MTAFLSTALVAVGTLSFLFVGHYWGSRLHSRVLQNKTREISGRPSQTIGLKINVLWSLWIGKRAVRQRQEAVREVFPQSMEIAIQSLKAGQTVPQAFELLATESAYPLNEEYQRIIEDMAWGASAEDALARFAERFPSPDVDGFLKSYRLSRQTGASLTGLLKSLLEGMETRNRLRRRMESLTAQARLSGLMMGVLPFFLAVILSFMDPKWMIPLFTTSIGIGILLTALFLEIIGFFWIKSLMTLEA